MKLEIVESLSKPGPEYLEITKEQIPRIEKLFADVDGHINEIDQILKQYGYEPKDGISHET